MIDTVVRIGLVCVVLLFGYMCRSRMLRVVVVAATAQGVH